MLLGIQLALALPLCMAATGKVLDAEAFAGVLRLSKVPARMVRPLGVAVPAIELALTFAVVVAGGAGLQLAFVAIAGLMAAFTLWMVRVRAAGLKIRCGCFGAGGTEVGPATIARNVVLTAAAVTGAVVAGDADGILPGPSVPAALTAAMAITTVALARALWGARRQLVLTMRGLHALQLAHSHGADAGRPDRRSQS